jgi:hypothetical protein
LAQKTAWDAAALTESDINTYLMHEGGAWTTWTPTLTQSGSVTVTVTRATYARSGRKIEFHASLAVTGTGTGANPILMSLPVTAASSGHPINGVGYIYDATVGNYPGIAYLNSTTTVGLISSTAGAGLGLLGQITLTAALASGDSVFISGTYQAAS